MHSLKILLKLHDAVFLTNKIIIQNKPMSLQTALEIKKQFSPQIEQTNLMNILKPLKASLCLYCENNIILSPRLKMPLDVLYVHLIAFSSFSTIST